MWAEGQVGVYSLREVGHSDEPGHGDNVGDGAEHVIKTWAEN